MKLTLHSVTWMPAFLALGLMLIIPTAFICEYIGQRCGLLIGGVLISGTSIGKSVILQQLKTSDHENLGYVIGFWILWLFYGMNDI